MMPSGYQIRLAEPEDVPLLPQVEWQAARLFLTCLEKTGMTPTILDRTQSIADFEQARQAGRLWVAVSPNGQLVGFAIVRVLGGYAHLEELNVLIDHSRQGLGSALVAAVCDGARSAGYPGVTLRTFRDVPWNAPFYQRYGFCIVDSAQLSPHHGELENTEQRLELRTDLRVSMVYRCD